ncbi:MAG: hypothetical protein NTV54_00190 [Ignavibacteriales bacterium]|nr:hypothetical protein [Ignavibacteriales bacterium]
MNDLPTIFGEETRLFVETAVGKVSQIFSSFRQTLVERGMDIRDELRTASRKSTDYEAREYLRLFNLKLRQHVGDFPTHYNNPVRQPSQGGKLRERLYIPPINIIW